MHADTIPIMAGMGMVCFLYVGLGFGVRFGLGACMYVGLVRIGFLLLVGWLWAGVGWRGGVFPSCLIIYITILGGLVGGGRWLVWFDMAVDYPTLHYYTHTHTHTLLNYPQYPANGGGFFWD